MNTSQQRPLVLITGASGNLGQSLAVALSDSYRVVGLDRQAQDGRFPILQADFSSPSSIDLALHWTPPPPPAAALRCSSI